MTTPAYPRELIVIDDVTITAIGALAFRSALPQWSANPRFQLVITSLTASGADPQFHVDIEHAIDSANPEKLFEGLKVQANGTFPVYAEQLATKHPFPLLRAKVIKFQDLTSVKARLVGYFDKP